MASNRQSSGASAPKDPTAAVRAIMAALPETEEVESHGNPDFRVRGKTFAMHTINHHGDGRVALWLRMPSGSQEHYVENEPEHYFRPPYLGGKGWLGVLLNRGLRWSTIAERVRTAYETAAPAALTANLVTPTVTAPEQDVDPADFDPWSVPAQQPKLERLRQLCLALPEVAEDRRFGDPVWRAGKKVFATAYGRKRRVYISVWVGVENQAFYVRDSADDSIHVPPYTGGHGWISIDVTKRARWPLITGWVEQSYRHFALKRMLKALPGE